ncbi:unnamed protein product [Prorocentrum cordatum]|uniref:Uncharacterized protein n=1 Tax=Prorocentrum cordatum TaxID=2364126 RepID=A0ABN9WSF5_9DINO|nr:unnamed protein product [Polarella glacialis]
MHYNVRAGRRGTAKSWASGVGATWRPSRASTNHQANLAQNKGAQNERIIIAFIRPQTEHDDPFRVRSRKTRAYDDWTKPQRKMDLSRHAAAAWGSPRRGRRLRFARPRRSSAQARNNKIVSIGVPRTFLRSKTSSVTGCGLLGGTRSAATRNAALAQWRHLPHAVGCFSCAT